MKRKSHAGITSVSLPIFVVDTSSATGAGLAGLVFNTASLVAEYRRQGSATWTTITLVTNTLGTYTSSGFVADGSLAGAYEFCPPNAALASGARWVEIRLYGAANMKPVLIEIELDAVDYQDATAFGLGNLDAAISTRSTYAGGAVATVTGNVGGNVVGSVGSVADKTGFALSAAGLDAVAVESGLNARQSLSIIAAAVAGTGGTTSNAYKGAGVTTTRIGFSASAGERSAVTLSPPV